MIKLLLRHRAVKTGKSLATLLATEAGLPYSGETLTEVLGAVSGSYLSDAAIINILEKEYKGVTPSDEIIRLLQYTWCRLYTWNIDDSIENINRTTAQRRRNFNGMRDKASEFEGPDFLHVVHLHGQITKPDAGFILSETEYAETLKGERHFWYQRAAQDYIAFCPIFIGSALQEPILNAELERAKRDNNTSSGRAYLISPDDYSAIKLGNFKSKGIVHIKATLEEFVNWLDSHFSEPVKPKDVVAARGGYGADVLHNVTRSDIEIANAIRLINPKEIRQKVNNLPDHDKSYLARRFLQGFPPSWEIASSDIPVKLTSILEIDRAFGAAYGKNDQLFVVIGQSGSGKTTATMISLLKYAEENDCTIYEITSDVRSVRRALEVIKKIGNGKKSIVYIGDLFIYGDAFRDETEAVTGGDLIIVSTARSGEWHEHLDRRIGDRVKPISFERFSAPDYEPLINRLISYVPAPAFRKLTLQDQKKKLAQSRSQLLIALREATESRNFTDIITHEFEHLPDEDTRMLLLTVGISTLARVGISIEAAAEAYNYCNPKRDFSSALLALTGIIGKSEDGRLIARHELYVRHIINDLCPLSAKIVSIKSILHTFVKYNIPVIRSVDRRDAALFRFLLNHRFVVDQVKDKKDRHRGVEIYQDFEVQFQLDGHYWLQYGLYLAQDGNLEVAMDMLQRSIQAYPENSFAVHALADLKLRAARERRVYDEITKNLIAEAVRTLKLQDAHPTLELDTYPIVTLANGHVPALLRHGLSDVAKQAAVEYFDRLQQMDKRVNSDAIKLAKDRMLKFVTLNEWDDGYRKSGRNASNASRRNRKRQSSARSIT
ncbi:SIR2 family protein [Ancylobacter sp. VNQ12]|uniref:P-loop NTPase n=1 Tax=Ancylobacter sp. VNQ12 TaxID=3400920 RepID=UPI003C0C0ACC